MACDGVSNGGGSATMSLHCSQNHDGADTLLHCGLLLGFAEGFLG
jgi:hypothetical protein